MGIPNYFIQYRRRSKYKESERKDRKSDSSIGNLFRQCKRHKNAWCMAEVILYINRIDNISETYGSYFTSGGNLNKEEFVKWFYEAENLDWKNKSCQI